jgi:hypothetical protein
MIELGVINGVEVALVTGVVSLWPGVGWQPTIKNPINTLKANSPHVRLVMHTQLSNDVHLDHKNDATKSGSPVIPGS